MVMIMVSQSCEPRGTHLLGTTGPKMLRGPASRGQQHGEGNVMNASQLQGLQSDALRMLTMREGCSQQPNRQFRASGLALGDLRGLSCTHLLHPGSSAAAQCLAQKPDSRPWLVARHCGEAGKPCCCR